MEIIHVTTKKELDYLYENWALTIIGLSEKCIPDYWDDIKSSTTYTRERMFVIKGKLMNETYGLTGDNAYGDNLTLLSISLEDIDPDPITFKRFEIGAHWFNDIVDNDLRRQAAINGQ